MLELSADFENVLNVKTKMQVTNETQLWNKFHQTHYT